MIINVEYLFSLPDFRGRSETELNNTLKAVELMIRAYTRNSFQNPAIRFEAASYADKLYGISPFLKAGDTIQITKSGVNDGIYTVSEITDRFTRVEGVLFQTASNLVTKIEYPADVIQGVVDLMKWEVNNRDKVGIKAETLSRHSVTYFEQDAGNTVMGYPVSLLGFLQPYMKAGF